ncbi:hypothetical protein VTJ49DRAFT_3685 [Mycothermus thermophilus]|uniref:Centromere protein X n=1 Tax=Humicola insolens TaxID=85995 RepID=A0ABR3V6W7_HUMIN
MPPKATGPGRGGRVAASNNRTATSNKPTTNASRSTTAPRGRGDASTTTGGASRKRTIDDYAHGGRTNTVDEEEEEEEEPQQDEEELEAVEEEEEEEEEDDDREKIPPELLTRILHACFEREGTRITREADRAVGRYVDVFVREAIARAAVERGRGFLEVCFASLFFPFPVCVGGLLGSGLRLGRPGLDVVGSAC